MALFFVVCAESTLNFNPKDESHVVFVRGANVGVPRLSSLTTGVARLGFYRSVLSSSPHFVRRVAVLKSPLAATAACG